MNAPSGTVYVVDDDASFLSSLVRMLRASGYTAIGFSSAADFLAQRGIQTPACVVVDLQMPGMDGLTLQKTLGQSVDSLPLVFLSGQGEIPDSVQAMRNGAEDFLTKTAPREALVAAIERALARDALERQDRARQLELHRRFAHLTPRENEVLGYVLRGRMNKQIAAVLGIHERSVKRHRTSLMHKLGTKSVAELVKIVAESDLPFKAGTSKAAPDPADR